MEWDLGIPKWLIPCQSIPGGLQSTSDLQKQVTALTALVLGSRMLCLLMCAVNAG